MTLQRGGGRLADWGPWFTAKFNSDCGACDEPIEEDDQARYNPDGEVVCEECGLEGGD